MEEPEVYLRLQYSESANMTGIKYKLQGVGVKGLLFSHIAILRCLKSDLQFLIIVC